MMGAPELSKGFFQSFFLNKVQTEAQPVLQVLEARLLKNQAQPTYRVRMSDGLHSYSGCGVASMLSTRFREDGLDSANGILRITDYNRHDSGVKITLTIADYEIVSLDYPVLGTPTAHSGKPEDYTGIENFNVNNKPTRSTLKREGDDDYNGHQPFAKRQLNTNSTGGAGVTAVRLITPFINKWRICGIVSHKENIREINSRAKGPMSVFSFIVTDQAGDAIKVSAFSESAEKFNPIITNGQTYYISGGGSNSVRNKNPAFNSTGHDFELYLNRDSEVTVATDTQLEQPKFRLKVVPLGKINEHVGALIDVLAIVDRVAEITQVTKKDGTPLEKRDVFLVDQSGVEVTLTLWDDKARDFDSSNVGQVIGIKGCSVREFNGGFSLSPARIAEIKFNPEGDATNQLYVWHQEKRPNETLRTMSSTLGDTGASFERDLRLIGMAVQHRIGQNDERGAYFNVKAMVTSIKTENAFYQACPTENCRKKLVVDNNQYRCEKCNSTFDTFKNIIMLQVEIADFSGTAWATIFDEKAQILLGHTGDQLAQLHKEDAAQYEAVFEKIRFKEFNIRVRVKYDVYNDQQQMRWTIFDLKPIPYDRCKKLYQETIQKCEALTV